MTINKGIDRKVLPNTNPLEGVKSLVSSPNKKASKISAYILSAIITCLAPRPSHAPEQPLFQSQDLQKEYCQNREPEKPEEPKVLSEVEERIEYLKVRYGIIVKVMTPQLYSLNDNLEYKHLAPSEYDAMRNLIAIENAYKRLPSKMQERLRQVTFFVGEGERPNIGGNYMPHDQMIQILHADGRPEQANREYHLPQESGSLTSVFHEIFHAFDIGVRVKEKELRRDAIPWEKRTRLMERIDKHCYSRCTLPRLNPEVVEDRAVRAEMLFDPTYLRYMLETCIENKGLQEKVEILTGCHLDPKMGRFTHNFTLDEYKKLTGFKGYRYFYQWSEGKMNFEYWNAILDGHPKEFDTD